MTSRATHSDHTVAIYPTHMQAEEAIKSLQHEHYNMNDLSIIGQDYQSEEQPMGFINTGDRMMYWGKNGAFWGSMWGLLFGSALMFVPAIGPVAFAGYVIGALEGALIGGGIGLVGGALASFGIPEDSVIEYEKSIKAGNFLLIAHGSTHEVLRAQNILIRSAATQVTSYPQRELTTSTAH